MPQLANRALTFLEEHHVPFETLEHRAAFTSQGVAKAAHVSGWTLAKIVVIHDEDGGGPFLVVLPAACRLDLQALERRTQRRHLRLATEAEMQSLFPDCETGAMPPFGNLYGLQVYVDACFPKARDFLFQPGNHHEVVRLAYADFERLVQPAVAEICAR